MKKKRRIKKSIKICFIFVILIALTIVSYWSINNNGGKDFNKIKNNREANKLAQKFGYKNAESFKREFVFNDGVHFNIALNKSTGEIILVSIYNSKIVINTGFFYR